MRYTLTCNRGYLDPEDRISLEKLTGTFLTSKAIFEPKLEFRVSYKGGSKMDPPFGFFENERNEMDSLA